MPSPSPSTATAANDGPKTTPNLIRLKCDTEASALQCKNAARCAFSALDKEDALSEGLLRRGNVTNAAEVQCRALAKALQLRYSLSQNSSKPDVGKALDRASTLLAESTGNRTWSTTRAAGTGAS